MNLAIMFVMVSVSPVKAMLMMVKTKIGDLVIVTLFVIFIFVIRLLVHTKQTCIYGQSKKGKVQNIVCRRKGIWPAFIIGDP